MKVLPLPRAGAGTPALVLAAFLWPAAAWACDCGAGCPCGAGCLCGTGPAGGPTELQVRKNQNSLTQQEIDDFIGAILTLKSTSRPGSELNRYDEFVQTHINAFLDGHAHGGPAFLPWHREFLLEFEHELQTVNPNVTIPYWDFTVDNSPTSSLWSSTFLGGNGDPNNGYVVTDGPFQAGQWKLAFDGPDLRRDFGDFVTSLPTAEDLAAAFGVRQYDAFPYSDASPGAESFRNSLEGFATDRFEPELHNRVHAWLGGSSLIVSSPNDPIFWLLHANLDRVWAEWQAAYGLDYLPTEGGPEGHNLHDVMSPFGVSPADVLDHHALGYRYDTEGEVGPAGFADVPATPNPEPASLALLGAGAAALAGYLRWRRKGAA